MLSYTRTCHILILKPFDIYGVLINTHILHVLNGGSVYRNTRIGGLRTYSCCRPQLRLDCVFIILYVDAY